MDTDVVLLHLSILTRTASSGNITDRLHWNATISSSSSSSKSLKYHHLLLSPIFLLLKVDPPCNLEDILVGERTIWIEVVAASSFQPSHQLAHVSRKAVLGGSSCQAAAPEKMFAGVTSGAKSFNSPNEGDQVSLTVRDVFSGFKRMQLTDQLGQAMAGDGGEHLLPFPSPS